MSDMFTFRDSLEPEGSMGLPKKSGGGAGETEATDLAGFKVHASDGSIGTVMDASYAEGDAHIIVDTGATILSKRVVLPAGVIERVDRDDRTVHVNATKDEIKAAPEFDEERYRDTAYRDELAAHYRR